MPHRIIAERDLGIVCDSSKCTRQAWYICTIRTAELPYARLYCPQHTAELLQGAAKMLPANESLSAYIETEHLFQGAEINA